MTFVSIDVFICVAIDERTIWTGVRMKVQHEIDLITLKLNRMTHFLHTMDSQLTLTSDESISLSRFFIAKMVGWENSVATFQQRFKSWPIKLHRLLPKNTPSGFTIGTILNTKFSRKTNAIGWVPRRNSIRPWHTNDVTDSPGWDRANTTMTRMKFFVSTRDGFGTRSMVINSSLRFCCNIQNFKWKSSIYFSLSWSHLTKLLPIDSRENVSRYLFSSACK